MIESSLDISDVQLGYLGSLVYAGIVVLGIFGGPLFIRFNPKIIIQTSLLAMMASLCLFTIKYQMSYPYFIIRFLTGIAQVFNKFIKKKQRLHCWFIFLYGSIILEKKIKLYGYLFFRVAFHSEYFWVMSCLA